jgi:glycosyltransferase involved in cell wall biosynthesis
VSSIFHDYLWRVFFAQTLSIGDIDFSRMAFWGSEINHAVAQYLNTIYTGICTLDTDNFDLYLGQAPFPLHISQKTKLALRWHDSIPITHPDTIHNKVQHNKYFIQNFNLNKGKAFFICNSEHTKNILLEIEPNIKNRAIVSYCAVDIEQQLYTDIKLHKNIIQYYSTEIKYNGEKYYIPDKVFDPDIPYLLAVGTIEPRKNYITLLSAWEEYNIEQKENIQLIIVGNIGWGLNKVLHDITHYLKNAHGLFILQNVPTYNLKRIYSHAIATVVPSIEEGFSYSGVESMAAGTIVLASDISVHREIYNDNALFFNPYSIEDLKNLINKVVSIKNTNDYNKIILKAKQYCTKYSFAASSQRWAKILQTISQW